MVDRNEIRFRRAGVGDAEAVAALRIQMLGEGEGLSPDAAREIEDNTIAYLARGLSDGSAAYWLAEHREPAGEPCAIHSADEPRAIHSAGEPRAIHSADEPRAIHSAGEPRAIHSADGVRIVGMAGICFFPLPPNDWCPRGLTAYLTSVYTASAFRGRGIATRLTALALDEAGLRGCERIWLHTSRAGKPIYDKFSFLPTDELMSLYPFRRVGGD